MCVAYPDAHASPVFVGDIGDKIILDEKICRNFAFIFRLPGAVDLIAVFLVVSGQDAISSDILQEISF